MWVCLKCNITFDAVRSDSGTVKCISCGLGKFVVNKNNALVQRLK